MAHNLEDYKTEALSRTEIIPEVLVQTVKDVSLHGDMEEDTLSYAQVKGLVKSSITRDGLDQVMPMEVDAFTSRA